MMVTFDRDNVGAAESHLPFQDKVQVSGIINPDLCLEHNIDVLTHLSRGVNELCQKLHQQLHLPYHLTGDHYDTGHLEADLNRSWSPPV